MYGDDDLNEDPDTDGSFDPGDAEVEEEEEGDVPMFEDSDE